ncbi:hypothetical protein CVU82_03120 [Candidatus Falkowbacteria bacterium HGW-Falkowbacteria-1]|jgi:hypothetical protein|uniref:Uncharacterized protein n=1 Tax=Candidatus Falkowbacteria bacterium HGW-Falkowbacteria-1 TaxID=2013768 RepID=A0A2N2EA24_9BACT|nr:MAG: hypothetical protein CVU82_03120 [Candidatus Falkowbacteria bacterium HGW-Falkowbacteria-1]
MKKSLLTIFFVLATVFVVFLVLKMNKMNDESSAFYAKLDGIKKVEPFVPVVHKVKKGEPVLVSRPKSDFNKEEMLSRIESLEKQNSKISISLEEEKRKSAKVIKRLNEYDGVLQAVYSHLLSVQDSVFTEMKRLRSGY